MKPAVKVAAVLSQLGLYYQRTYRLRLLNLETLKTARQLPKSVMMTIKKYYKNFKITKFIKFNYY